MSWRSAISSRAIYSLRKLLNTGAASRIGQSLPSDNKGVLSVQERGDGDRDDSANCPYQSRSLLR